MPAVYELTTLEIKVFSNAKVYEALQRSLPNAGGTLVGAFASDIGELSQVLLLRRFDNADALADARLAMLMAENPLGCGEWLVKLQSQSFALFPFLADPQPGALGKWYEFRTYSIRQGVLAQTIEAWKAGLPEAHRPVADGGRLHRAGRRAAALPQHLGLRQRGRARPDPRRGRQAGRLAAGGRAGQPDEDGLDALRTAGVFAAEVN